MFRGHGKKRDAVQPPAAPAGCEAPQLEVEAVLAGGVRHQMLAGAREPQQDGTQQGAVLVNGGSRWGSGMPAAPVKSRSD